MKARMGMVYLVGAGPGDPGLITVRGLAVLRRADVVVYDRLIARDLLKETRDGAELVDAGKSRGGATLPQGEIEALLVERARRGLRVVRLKGGDPYVFGRGYEEVSACRAAGVPCEVISGVTSAIAAPAAAGIPITCRKRVRSVAIITGTVASESESAALDFTALAKIDTVIALMGRENLAKIAAALVAGGRNPATPAAIIQSGTTLAQRVVRGTLGTIARLAEEARLEAPVVTVVGEVAACASEERSCTTRVNEFDPPEADDLERVAAQGTGSPLREKRIVVTRARAQSSMLTRRLERKGAIVIPCPLLRISFPALSDADRARLRSLPSFDCVAFTSANGVRGFFRALRVVDRDVRTLSSCRIAAVGKVTASALRRRGLVADVIPARQEAMALAAMLCEAPGWSAGGAGRVDPRRVLVVGGDATRDAFVNSIQQGGVHVECVTVYQNEPGRWSDSTAETLARGVDAVLLYSPSAATRWVAAPEAPHDSPVICIGRSTALAARDAGLRVVAVADHPSDAAMVAAVSRYFDSVAPAI